MFTNDRRNQNIIPDLFNALLGTEWNEPIRPRRFNHPAINIIEGDNYYKLEMVAPGMQKDDFDVKINNVGELVVAVEKKETQAATNNDAVAVEAATEDAEPKERFLRHEFSFPKFNQTFTLPEDVDLEAITARMADGILTIMLPKKKPVEPQDNTRLIKVM